MQSFPTKRFFLRCIIHLNTLIKNELTSQGYVVNVYIYLVKHMFENLYFHFNCENVI